MSFQIFQEKKTITKTDRLIFPRRVFICKSF